MKINKKLATVGYSIVLLAIPLVTMAIPNPNTPAYTPGTGGTILTVTYIVNIILNFIWPVFIGLAVIMFLLAGFTFLTAQGDEAKVATARQMLIWGAVGVVVGILAFSLPYIIANTVGLGGGA